MSTSCDADKHHAYLLGVSLYLKITDQDMGAMYRNHGKPTFDQPIFQTSRGQQLHQLIEGLLKEKPEDRLGLSEAKHQLAQMSHVENQSHQTRRYRETIQQTRQTPPLAPPPNTDPSSSLKLRS